MLNTEPVKSSGILSEFALSSVTLARATFPALWEGLFVSIALFIILNHFVSLDGQVRYLVLTVIHINVIDRKISRYKINVRYDSLLKDLRRWRASACRMRVRVRTRLTGYSFLSLKYQYKINNLYWYALT